MSVRVFPAVLPIAAAICFLSFPSDGAEDPPVKPPWEVIAECHMVALPLKAALPLIPDLSDDAKIDAAFARLEQMITRGEATLFATLVARGSDGMKLVSESVEELVYATEFNPPTLPPNIPEEKGLEALKAWPVVGITPTAFGKRNIGAILEVETNVTADGKWISASVVPQHVRLVRFAKFDSGTLASGEKLTMEQPHISVLKHTTSLRVRAGQRVLVGIHKIPAEENMMELFFLRIRVQKAGANP
jgi:hypothetical protein